MPSKWKDTGLTPDYNTIWLAHKMVRVGWSSASKGWDQSIWIGEIRGIP